MKTSSAKSKGRKLQNYVRDLILKHFNSLEEDDVKCAIMGESGIDLHLSPAARKLFPFSVECKNQETMKIWEWLKQCEVNVKHNTFPLLVFKRNRSKTYCVMELDHLVELLGDLNYDNWTMPRIEFENKLKGKKPHMTITDETTAGEIIDYTVDNNPEFKKGTKTKPKNNPERLKEIFDIKNKLK